MNVQGVIWGECVRPLGGVVWGKYANSPLGCECAQVEVGIGLAWMGMCGRGLGY